MTDEEAPPLVAAGGLGLRGKRGWIYQDVDLRLPADSATAVTGPAGSGRSMLLLTLAGRATPSTGTITVAGESDRGRIRQSVAVARVTSAAELEPEMRVVEHIREAELLTGGRYHTALGLELEPMTLVTDLAADDAVLFAVALALTGKPKAIVVDDLDIRATPAQQHRIWTAFRDAGCAVIATTVDGRIAAEAGATVVSISGGPSGSLGGEENTDARV